MRYERRFIILSLAGLALVLGVSPGNASSALAVERPVAVSPGDASKLALVESRCPTFSWGAAGGATSYELVVYRLGEEGEEAKPVLRETFAGSASSWTPSLERCLARGGRYAWSVRAVGGTEDSDEWSALSLFEVASRPSQAELDEALALVRQYFVSDGAADPEGVTEAAPKPNRESSSSSPDAPAAGIVGPTQLSVDGGVVATSFTGDGSTLTALDPANLAAGTAGIDISGDAGTVDGAEAADLEESAEIDADIAAHAGLADAHHVPTVDTDTILTESQVETFVTNGPLDGSQFTNLDASNLTTGTVAEARVADEITRDDEVLPIVLEAVVCPGAGGTERYTDCGDGTVRDNNTGLFWLKDANCFGVKNWDQAESLAAGLADGACGLANGSVAGDWRQPTISEFCSAWAGAGLFPCPAGSASDSLIDSSLGAAPFVTNAAGTGLWAEGDPFVGVQSSSYRSATEVDANWVWGVNLSTGNVTGAFQKTGLTFVWPVSSGPSVPLSGLEESAEIDADIAAHAGLADAHHAPTVDTTCNGVACDGTNFSSLQWANLTGLPTTTKGDLLVGDGADVVRLGVGSDGQVLIADSAASEGLDWATVDRLFSLPALQPETGKTTTITRGDDGDLRKGVSWPVPRFTKNGDGTVTDNLTGLIWLEDASCAELMPAEDGETRDWGSALYAAGSLLDFGVNSFCGLTDGSQLGEWRLPNIRELLSLVHYGEQQPAIPNTVGLGRWTEGDPFSGMPPLHDDNGSPTAIYWSSTLREFPFECSLGPDPFIFPCFAFAVDLGSGESGLIETDSSLYVLPVRGGQ